MEEGHEGQHVGPVASDGELGGDGADGGIGDGACGGGTPPATGGTCTSRRRDHGAKQQIAELTSQGDKEAAALIRAMIDTPQAVWFDGRDARRR